MSEKYPRVAIVTGATSGIGEAIARRLVKAGYAVLGNGRNKAKLDALEHELGTLFLGLAGDASEKSLISEMFSQAESQFGRNPDIVVVNAGQGLGGSVKDADLDDFDHIQKLNVTGALRLMQKAAKVLEIKQKNSYPDTAADIVVIGSVSGRHISPFSAVYGSTKFAVHSLAEGLRREMAPCGVRVSLVEPGLVLSGFQDKAGYNKEMVDGFEERFGPLLVGEDVAESVNFIVSQPPHVHISDIVIRPSRQDYP